MKKKIYLTIFCVFVLFSGNAMACTPPAGIERPGNIETLYALKRENIDLNAQQETLLAQFEEDNRRYVTVWLALYPCLMHGREMNPLPPHIKSSMEREMKAIARKWQMEVE
ncbi:MAG: hypothetical protein ACT4OY_02180 [Alphaproteobacteria bacterium]